MTELMVCLPSWPCNLGSTSASVYLVFKALHLCFHNFQVELMIRFEMPWYIKWNWGRGFRKEVVGCWGVSVEPLEIVWEVNSANKMRWNSRFPSLRRVLQLFGEMFCLLIIYYLLIVQHMWAEINWRLGDDGEGSHKELTKYALSSVLPKGWAMELFTDAKGSLKVWS